MALTLLMLFVAAIGVSLCILALVDRFSPVERVLTRAQWFGVAGLGAVIVIAGGMGQYFFSFEAKSLSTGQMVAVGVSGGLLYLLGAVAMTMTLVFAMFAVLYLRELIIARRQGVESRHSPQKRRDILAKAGMYPMFTVVVGVLTVTIASRLAG